MKFTSEEIEEAKKVYRKRYFKKNSHKWWFKKCGESHILHEHHDCIHIAVEWLSAQALNKNKSSRSYLPLKHIIEAWGGRYVSESDVCVAAILLGLKGEYSHFNLKSRLVFPSLSRLNGIGEAYKHHNYLDKYSADYKSSEDEGLHKSLNQLCGSERKMFLLKEKVWFTNIG